LNDKSQVVEEEASAPAYLVTFTALVTLLMLFFITLLSFASTQQEGIGGKGQYTESRESFFRAIRNLGLGMFYGKKQGPDFGSVKPKYFIAEPDKLTDGRTIDAKEEGIRRTFQAVSQSMETMRSQIVAERTNFSVTDIRFPPGDATLNTAAKRFLTKFSSDLQQDRDSKALRLYVLGLAGDEATEKKQWILSARRAQAVADFLQDILPSRANWPVYSWGAGRGGDWVTQDSPISGQSQILIAVLRS
jgi:outer membrane protein OmpA-like peptidoglycan-associated protein